jgi:hypothetical protein
LTDDLASDSAMRLVIGACLVAFVVCFAWAVSTLFLSEPVIHTHVWLVTFLGIFPLVFFVASGGRGIRAWRPRRISFSVSELRDRLPPAVLVVGMTLFFVCWVLAVTALWALKDGGPTSSTGPFTPTATER